MIYCRKCGNEMPDDSVFCNKCGFNQNEQVNNSPPAHQAQSPKAGNSSGAESETMYFGHSTQTITAFVMSIAAILLIGIVVTMFINGQISELAERDYLYGSEIRKLKSLRNWNLFFDALFAGSLLWRCVLTSKNYLRISGDTINGVCCPTFGFTTVDVYDFKIKDILEMEAKNNNTLLVRTDRKYAFLIENAEKAYWNIYKQIHEE